MTNDTSTDSPSTDNPSSDGPPNDPPPPAGSDVPPGPAGVRRLVRDPYSRLGGVASGIAHHYGFEVSLVRIAFVLFTLATGFGLLAYLLAWLIIPRADYWPPAPPPNRRAVGRRDLGLILAGAGLLAALAFGGSTAGSFLVPVLLVGGGVWLLVQPAADLESPPGSPPSEPPPAAFSASPPPPGAPVPPRSRGRRVGLVAFVVAIVLGLLLIPLLLIGGLIGLIINGNVEFDTDRVSHRPLTVEQLDRNLHYDGVELTLDLTHLSAEDFDDLATPVDVDIDADAGEIEVIVPDDLAVSVDAESIVGEIQVFNRSSDGIRNDVVTTVDDPDIDLSIDLGAGQITVTRGG